MVIEFFRRSYFLSIKVKRKNITDFDKGNDARGVMSVAIYEIVLFLL